MGKGRSPSSVPFKADLLKKKMKEKKITQQQLSEGIHFARQTINRVLNSGIIETGLLYSICNYLDINPLELTDDKRLSYDEDDKSMVFHQDGQFFFFFFNGDPDEESLPEIVKQRVIDFCSNYSSSMRSKLESLTDEDFQVFQDHIIEARDKTIEWFFNEYLPGKGK